VTLDETRHGVRPLVVSTNKFPRRLRTSWFIGLWPPQPCDRKLLHDRRDSLVVRHDLSVLRRRLRSKHERLEFGREICTAECLLSDMDQAAARLHELNHIFQQRHSNLEPQKMAASLAQLSQYPSKTVWLQHPLSCIRSTCLRCSRS